MTLRVTTGDAIWTLRKEKDGEVGVLKSGRYLLLLCVLMTLEGLSSDVPVGYRPHPHPLRHLTNAVVRTSAASTGRIRLKAGASLPTKYDLRNVDGASCLSPVRNQNPYGTCWAFSAMGVLEWVVRKDEGIDADFSENNLVNMHGFACGFNDGGNDFMSVAVFLREEGPIMEILDPYAHPGVSVRERAVRIPRKVVFVPKRTSVIDPNQLQSDISVIKQAVLDYGPLSTSYYHSDTYCKGAAYYCTVIKAANHAVSIIGWDDDYSATNFKTPPSGNGAFIIRNSWGTGHFDCGYMYVSYYDRTLGFDGQVAYASLSKGDDYGHVYQHDFYGYVDSDGYDQEMAYAANVFVARTNEMLSAFGFYALEKNTSYSAFIVRDPDLPGDDIVGDWIPVKEGIRSEAGYEVIPFDTPVAVSNAATFAIVVKLTSPGMTKPIAVCGNEPLFVTNMASVAGRSLFCQDHERYYWEDKSSQGKYFCCKVYAAPRVSSSCTTSTDVPVPYDWLDNYVSQKGTDHFTRYYLCCYNALAEHVAANRLSVAASFAKGIDPDNATVTNLITTISFDAFGNAVIGVEPENTLLWDYTVFGSENLRDWHRRTSADRFFKVSVQPR